MQTSSVSLSYKQDEAELFSAIRECCEGDDVLSRLRIPLEGWAQSEPSLIALVPDLKQPWEITGKDGCQKLIERIERAAKLLTGGDRRARILESLQQVQKVYQNYLDRLKVASQQERTLLLQGRVQLCGVEIGCHFLNPEAAAKLLENKKENQSGIHTVTYYHGLYWKKNPEAPGIERAVDALHKRVAGEGSPPTCVLKMTAGQTRVPLMVSKGVNGEGLNKVMEHHPERLLDIDPFNFSLMVILGILVDPTDGKPENFILSEGSISGKYRLIAIDNDLAFSNGIFMTRDKQHLIDVMYAPFCFAQMDQPIEAKFCQKLKELSPELVVYDWVRNVIDLNTGYKKLRTDRLFSPQELKELHLPVALMPAVGEQSGFVARLYQKLKALQKVLQEKENPTHWDLFLAAHPLVGRYYQTRIREFYTKNPQGSVLDAFYFVFADLQTVEGVLNLESRVRSRVTVGAEVQKHQLGVGTETTMRTQSARRALEEFLSTLDFSTLSVAVQERLLQKVMSASFLKHLSLTGSSILNDEHLQAFSSNCVKLQSLRVIACPGVTVAGLSIFFPRQTTKITVGHCPQLGLEAYKYIAAHCPNFSIELNKDDIVRLKPPFDSVYEVWEKNKEVGKRLIAALVFSGVTIDPQSAFELLLTKFESPVELLLEGDRLRECLPSKETYEQVRGRLVKVAYEKGYSWANTFEDTRYLEGAVWRPSLAPKQENESPLSWILRRFERLKSLNLCGVKDVTKNEAEMLCKGLSLSELALDTKQMTDFVPLKLNHFGELLGRISNNEIFKVGNTIIKLEGVHLEGARGEDVMGVSGLLMLKPEITCLTLENSLHHPNHLMVLLKVLPHCSIKTLSLARNRLTAGDIKGLAEVLPQTKISRLSLSSNSIGYSGCKELSRVLPQILISQLNLEGNAMVFGTEEWKRYYGDVGVEPPLPSDIDAILDGPCPFWLGKRVYETHLLVLIPEKVNGKPFTLDSLGEMIEKPKEGYATKYAYYTAKEEHGNKTVPKGYWVLMTRDVLPGSRYKSYNDQKQQVGGYRGYEVPKLLEAATAVLMEHVRTGKGLYSDDPWTYTRCQEQIIGYQGVVGGLSLGGLGIYPYVLDGGSVGVGAARKFLG